MKYLINILLSLLFVAICSCTDDDILGGIGDDANKGKITVSLTAGDLQTRTLLNSSSAVHQVEKVYVALYEVGDDGEINNAEFKACKKFNSYTKPSEQQPGAIDKYTESFTYPAQDGKEYVVLAIGLDAQSEDVFGFHDENAITDSLRRRTTLGNAYAVFWQSNHSPLGPGGGSGTGPGDGGNGTDPIDPPDPPDPPIDPPGPPTDPEFPVQPIDPPGPTDPTDPEILPGTELPHLPLSHAELFAGWNTFIFNPDVENQVEVELRRRVAGVFAYLKDIPRTLDNYLVTRVRLVLNQRQHYAISLARKDKDRKPDGTFSDDFGRGVLGDSDDVENRILMGVILHGEFDGGKPIGVDPNEGSPFWNILPEYTAKMNILPNTLMLSSYMLPIEKLEKDSATLSIQLMGRRIDNGALSSTEETFTSFPLLAAGKKTHYNIYPNMIYHVGEKSSKTVDEGDKPISLAGTHLNLQVSEWQNRNVGVEFPDVPVFATMDLVNEEGRAYNTNKYIFDCIGIDDEDPKKVDGTDYYQYYLRKDRLILKINPSLIKNPWKVTITGKYTDGVPSSTEMLYIRNASNEYVQEYVGTSNEDRNQGKEIVLLLTDFAKNIPDKLREATIRLDTYDENNTEIIHTEYKTISQYNAIPVVYDGRKLGFSHYDWGTKRNLQTGEADLGEAAKWNYLGGPTAQGIFGKSAGATQNNGAENYVDALDRATNYSDMRNAFYYGTSKNGSAMYKASKRRLQIVAGNKQDFSTPWFLPAYYEFEKFLLNNKQNKDLYNIKNTGRYWTSSIPKAAVWKTLTLFYKGNGISYANEDRDNSYYMRQACEIK